jgi:transposase
MSQNLSISIAVIGMDIGKNSFHIVGLDNRGAVVLRQRWSCSQVKARFINFDQRASQQFGAAEPGGVRRHA